MEDITLEQMLEFAKRARMALARGDDRFEWLNRWWVIGPDGKISYSYPEPEGQTHEDIDYMRATVPHMVKMMQMPEAQQQFLDKGEVLNWDMINDMETRCGLPLTPCPNSIATQKLGLKK